MTHTAAKCSPLLLVTSIALASIVSACGGGGGGDSGTPTTPIVVTPDTPTTDIDTEFGEYLVDLTDTHIIPGYTAMQTQAQALSDASASFCALDNPTNAELSDLQQNWRNFTQSWQQVQWVKVGAIVEDNRLFRIQFWPDSNDAVDDAVSDFLIEQVTIDAEYLSTQSVGGQGIPALEILLFPENNDDSLINADDSEKRCEITTAIAENLLNISTDISTDWQETGGDYRSSVVDGTGEFESRQEVIEQLVTNWLQHIEIVEDSKLNEILGTESTGNVEESEHYLSDESLVSIATNINTILTVYTNGDGKGFDSILIDFLEQQSISDEMTASLNSVLTQITAINQNFDSYEVALSDEGGRSQISDLVDEMRILIDLIDVNFTQALDLNLGFNSTDGD